MDRTATLALVGGAAILIAAALMFIPGMIGNDERPTPTPTPGGISLAALNFTQFELLGSPIECTALIGGKNFAVKVRGQSSLVDVRGPDANYTVVYKSGKSYISAPSPLLNGEYSDCDWVEAKEGTQKPAYAFVGLQRLGFACVYGLFGIEAFATNGITCEYNESTSPPPPPECPDTCLYGCVPNTTICTQIICPSNCLYGCEPGTDVCRQPICPIECLYGCEPGTSICLQSTENVTMNNTDFETGDYTGWTVVGNAFYQFKDAYFGPNGPKNMLMSNIPPNSKSWCWTENATCFWEERACYLDYVGTMFCPLPECNCGECYNQSLHLAGKIRQCCELPAFVSENPETCPCSANGLGNACPGYRERMYTDFQGTFAASSTPYAGATGALISQPFLLAEPYLEFLAIGPEDADLCVAVKLDNGAPHHRSCAEARRDPATIGYFSPYIPATMPNAHFRRVAFNLTNWTGERAMIEVIDTSVRNHIEVDFFRQIDEAPEGIPISPDSMPERRAAFPCNNDGICDQFAGEFEETCPSDCPPPSGCFEFMPSDPGVHSISSYTYRCAAYGISEKGLYLEVMNWGDGISNSTKILGLWCSEQVPGNATRINFTEIDIPEPRGVPFLLADGTFPCYNATGGISNRTVGSPFVGRAYLNYMNLDNEYLYYVPIYIKTIVKAAPE